MKCLEHRVFIFLSGCRHAVFAWGAEAHHQPHLWWEEVYWAGPMQDRPEPHEVKWTWSASCWSHNTIPCCTKTVQICFTGSCLEPQNESWGSWNCRFMCVCHSLYVKMDKSCLRNNPTSFTLHPVGRRHQCKKIKNGCEKGEGCCLATAISPLRCLSLTWREITQDVTCSLSAVDLLAIISFVISLCLSRECSTQFLCPSAVTFSHVQWAETDRLSVYCLII